MVKDVVVDNANVSSVPCVGEVDGDDDQAENESTTYRVES